MTRDFLPFTPNGRATELAAIKVKGLIDLRPTVATDPFEVLQRVPARLVDATILRSRDPVLARLLFGDARDEWSGIGYGKSPRDGASLILLNPAHARTRQRATLMEEIVHVLLDHPKTRLDLSTSAGSWIRPYDAAAEDEAYNVGAACILPYPELFHALHDRHEGAMPVAERAGVSVDYVEFRIKRAGLSAIYRKHCTPARGGVISSVG